jgi:hypothetical protein
MWASFISKFGAVTCVPTVDWAFGMLGMVGRDLNKAVAATSGHECVTLSLSLQTR